MTREDLIRRYFDRTMRLVELGPSHCPIVPKRDGWQTTVIDHADQAELVAKYASMNVAIDRIEPVDYVWHGGALAALVPTEMCGTFDGLIASHVGEHLPDLIGFFKDASALIKPDGVMALALPDKRVCFDFFHPLTTTGDLVDAHLHGQTRHQRRIIFNHVAYFTTRGSEGSWAHAGSKEPFSLVNSIFQAQSAYECANEDPVSPYQDCHAWAFTPKSFELLLLELNLLGHTDWWIRSIEPAQGVEFYVWLERKRVTIPEIEVNSARLSLLTDVVYECRDAIAQLDEAEPTRCGAKKTTVSEAAGMSGRWPLPIPSIAVVIPLYNGSRHIEEALSSVFRQTVPASEIIVVDDGSTDNGEGPAVVERLAKTHSVTFLRKANGGQSSARNLGVRHSNSELIAFLDQDDIWYDNHLQELAKPFQKRSVRALGWVYSNLDEINEGGSLVCRDFLDTVPAKHPKSDIDHCIGHDMFVLPSAALISREAFEAVKGFDERLCGYEDDDLFLRILCKGYDNVYLDVSLSKWRIHQGSASYSPRMTHSRSIYARKLLEMFPDDASRARRYARLIAPRFLVHSIREYQEAVKLGDMAAVDEAWAEIELFQEYDATVIDRLFNHTVLLYKAALIERDNARIAAAWTCMAGAAARLPKARLRVRAAVSLLRNPRLSKAMFALRYVIRPATRWAFSP
jgi:glycosyltransferase involved in cell wall biosynthesis/SAM-dependent methyltransferase